MDLRPLHIPTSSRMETRHGPPHAPMPHHCWLWQHIGALGVWPVAKELLWHGLQSSRCQHGPSFIMPSQCSPCSSYGTSNQALTELMMYSGRPPSQGELQKFLRPLGIKWESGISVDEFILAVEEAPEFENLTTSQLQGIIITQSKMSSASMWNPLTLFDAIKNSDRYKERSRLYRRTVFTAEDWVQFRSSERIFKNLATMFTSGVVRGQVPAMLIYLQPKA